MHRLYLDVSVVIYGGVISRVESSAIKGTTITEVNAGIKTAAIVKPGRTIPEIIKVRIVEWIIIANAHGDVTGIG
ncbi:MAG: hypothetical protein CUN57_01615 [Phototrophicales bacterium]|nr:MAG: hypothetical protein CUN57_01615 [Phototrophicales bacterium]